MRSVKLVSAVAALALVGTLGLAGCGSKNDSNASGGKGGAATAAAATDTASESASVEATNDSGGNAGFEEYPVGDEGDQQIDGQVNISVVYFQPVDMKPAGMALPAAEANLHLEADASGTEDNTLGYGAGDFVPGLTIKYNIADKATGETKAEGTFMNMNASDGPHYGANVALPDAGEYTLTLTVESPEKNGWVLHSDPETGVKGDFWKDPAVLSWVWAGITTRAACSPSPSSARWARSRSGP